MTSAISDLRHAGPPPEVAVVLPRLLREPGVELEGVTTLKPGAVFRIGASVAKLFRRSSHSFARLRRPQALRVVLNYHRLLPIRSPVPLHWDRLDHPRYESLLVYEFVEGRTLMALWTERDPEPLAALPRLLADLHNKRILHADLHAGNLVWGPEGWVVLDLDGVRHGMHAVRRRAITENIWARLLLDFEDQDAGEVMYREFLELAGSPWEAGASWGRIVRRSTERHHKREARLAARDGRP